MIYSTMGFPQNSNGAGRPSQSTNGLNYQLSTYTNSIGSGTSSTGNVSGGGSAKTTSGTVSIIIDNS